MKITASELRAYDILVRAGVFRLTTGDDESIKTAGDYVVDLAKKIEQERKEGEAPERMTEDEYKESLAHYRALKELRHKQWK